MRIKNRIDRLEKRIRPREEPEHQKMADLPDQPRNLEEWKQFCVWQLGQSYGPDVEPEMKNRWEEWAARTAALFERKMAQN
jgi:hypothetical protein